MKITITAPEDGQQIDIDLKNRGLAALLTWIIPGAGQLYQGRTAKGIIFMATIFSIFLVGMFIGGGRVVYANWQGEQKRLYYLCQVGIGLTTPALLQNYLVSNGNEPIKIFGRAIMAPPAPGQFNGQEELHQWHQSLGLSFELGTTYTVIAGLLNVLAIYDAFAGPFVIMPKKKNEEKDSPAADEATSLAETEDNSEKVVK